MKAFTDIEQSKMLAEILPIETADMYWLNRHIDLTETKYEVFVVDKSNKYIDFFKSYAVAIEAKEIIPSWSLAALLEVLQEYDLTKFVETECSFLCYCKGGDKLVYSPTPVDACVKMIELIAKEKEGYFKKEE